MALEGTNCPQTQTMVSHSHPSKLRPKSFSLGIYMAHIRYKADIHVPVDWLEPLLVGDLNITTVITKAIALKCNVTGLGKTQTSSPKNIA